MPRSTTPAEGRAARNNDRITRLVSMAIGQEIDSLLSEVAGYRRAARTLKHPAIDGQVKHLEDMIAALRRLQGRFVPNTKRHVPQECRDADGTHP